MTYRYAFVDPGLVIWDVAKFNENEGDYWGLAQDVIYLIEVIEKAGLSFAVSQKLLDSMIEAFPAQYLDHRKSELRDFSNSIYDFLSCPQVDVINFVSNGVSGCNPDLRARSHFAGDLTLETDRLLCFVYENFGSYIVFSHELISASPFRELKITQKEDSRDVECFANSGRYGEFLSSRGRLYEEYVKHDPLCGFGSRLPIGLDDAALQSLLDGAVEIHSDRVLCVYSVGVDEYILFRRHLGNRYHAYPIPQNELSRSGVNPAHIPRI